jgi:putative ABC transport system permease protein
MTVGWRSVSRQVLRRRAGYAPLVLAIALGFAIAVLATAFGERVAEHAHEMAALPPEARLQLSVATQGGRAHSAAEDLAALRALPGVKGASWLEAPPRTIWDRPELFDGPAGRFVGWVVAADETAPDTLALRLVAGRAPSREDASAKVTPLVVSRSFLADLGPGAGPGTRLRSVERAREAEVVGVVEDFLSHGRMRTSRSTVLWPMEPRDAPARTYLVRADEDDADALVERARDALSEPGRFVGVERTSEMLHGMNRPLLRARTVLRVLEGIVLGTLVLGLAAAAAARALERRRELAVLRALGATRQDVVVAVLAESTAVTAMGLAAGLAVVLALRGPLSHAIPFFTVRGAMIGAQALLFLAAGWLASLVPALRAARVAPWVAGR